MLSLKPMARSFLPLFTTGPYYCTEGKVDVASLNKCTQQPEKIDVKVLVDKAMSAAKNGQIDDPSYLKYQNVFLFSGTKDTVVVPGRPNEIP